MPRSIDAIDLARLAKQRGIARTVLKNHYDIDRRAGLTSSRKEVPGIRQFLAATTSTLTGRCVNPAAVERDGAHEGRLGKGRLDAHVRQ